MHGKFSVIHKGLLYLQQLKMFLSIILQSSTKVLLSSNQQGPPSTLLIDMSIEKLCDL